MWPRTDLVDLLEIEHPLIQAPMAGSATPALAAAVSNAGGLGSLGCGEMSPGDLETKVAELRSLTNRPFNLNFLAHDTPRRKGLDGQARTRMTSFFAERGLGEPPATARAPFGTFDAELLRALLESKPAIVSFHFGLPSREATEALRDAGSTVLGSATTVAEALLLVEGGVDAVIAQGWEAGGHRGSFEPSNDDVGVGTMALVPQVVDAVDVPVVAAGGIADGRGIAAAFALGASGVQLGTAFLSCPEAGVSEAHRAALRDASDDDTRLSSAFSGRPARTKNNRYVQTMADEHAAATDFPTMYTYTEPLMDASERDGDDDFAFLLYGQAAALNRELPAGELVATLVSEAQALLPEPK